MSENKEFKPITLIRELQEMPITSISLGSESEGILIGFGSAGVLRFKPSEEVKVSLNKIDIKLNIHTK